MLAVSAVSLSSATYAWFTMNKEVSVTGMMMRTQVGSNLLISETNEDAASYKNNLNQVRACTLEPSSTINGINYFWTSTSNVDAAGNAIAEDYTAYNEGTSQTHTEAGKTAYDNAFNTNYAFTSPTATYTGVAYGYVDYTFYLKAVNTEQTPQNLNLTKLNLLYNGAAPTAGSGDYAVVDKAWRTALIVQDITENFDYGDDFTDDIDAPTAANTVSMFTIAGATNHSGDGTTADYAVGKVGNADPAVMDLSYGSSRTAYNLAGTLDNIAAGAEKHYKVTVRVWLEGEDTTCTNQTYATLKNNYTLDLKFEYGGTAVTNISNEAVQNATATIASGTATATIAGTGSGGAHEGETAAHYQWYKVTNTFEYTAVGTDAATYTVPAGDTVFCVITTNTGLTYTTNTVTYTAPSSGG
jgi:hypothetical protein